ncbi:MAG TPA: phage holin family protein [Xanthobacteraceae bacterium]|nr:phage holin family protein [Xanthobacteraceae bacterium]
MNDLRNDARSISRLLGDAFEQLSLLIQTEIRLARAELADKATRAGTGVSMVFGGMLLLVPALVLFLIALAIFFMQQGMSPIVAHLLSGFIAAAGGAGLIYVGLSRLKPSELTPDTTIRQVGKDIAAAKEMAR